MMCNMGARGPSLRRVLRPALLEGDDRFQDEELVTIRVRVGRRLVEHVGGIVPAGRLDPIGVDLEEHTRVEVLENDLVGARALNVLELPPVVVHTNGHTQLGCGLGSLIEHLARPLDQI